MSAVHSMTLKYAVLVESLTNSKLSFQSQSAINIDGVDAAFYDPVQSLINGAPDSIPWDAVASFLSQSVRVSRSSDASTAVVLVWGCGLDLSSPTLLSALSVKALDQLTPCVYVPLSLVLFAMHSRGRSNHGACALLQHLVEWLHSDDVVVPVSSSGLPPAAIQFRSAFLSLLSHLPIQTELLVSDLCSSGTRFDAAWLRVQAAAQVCHQLGNCNALSALMTLLIPMLGHYSGQNDDTRRRALRDQAMRSLHCLIDGHDWQTLRPFEQSWTKILGSSCLVTVSLPIQHACESFAFVLHSPLSGSALDCGTPGDPALLEVINPGHNGIHAGRPHAALLLATVTAVDSRQGTKTVEVSFKLPSLTHCGFYDWKLVSISDGGKLIPHSCEGSAVCGRIIVIPDVRSAAMVELCPEFISQTSTSRQQSDRDISSDSVDSFDSKSGDSKRGSFSAAASLFPELKQKGYTSIHVVDALQRNHGAPPAFALTPQPPMMQVTDRAKFSAALGGNERFAELVSRAHELGMTVLIDAAVRVSSSKAASKYQQFLLKTVSPDNGYLVPHTQSDSCSLLWHGTSLLNYRRFAVWELMRADLLEAISSSGCDGCVLDSGINWPVILPQDIQELTSVNSDGHNFYSAEDLFFGSVVTTGPAISLYALKLETCYPSPLLAWLTRSIWSHFHSFCFISDTLAVKSADSKLMTCGVIPCSNFLSNEVQNVLGRYVIPGNMTAVGTSVVSGSCDNLSSYFDDINTLHKSTAVPRLPIESPIFKMSSPLYQPTPAVLFKRNNWSWVDIMSFSPGFKEPITFVPSSDILSRMYQDP
jgi:hypothetical protein